VKEAEQRGIRLAALATQARVDHLDALAQHIDAGRLKIFIGRTFPLAQAQAAMEYRQQATIPGKTVLTVL
jgi:NADPH:quinone reductase-like Zn-dependent oxidoreductase